MPNPSWYMYFSNAFICCGMGVFRKNEGAGCGWSDDVKRWCTGAIYIKNIYICTSTVSKAACMQHPRLCMTANYSSHTCTCVYTVYGWSTWWNVCMS